MKPSALTGDANVHARAALDQAATAIQALANAFGDGRSIHAAKNDLSRAREHLAAATREVTDAIGVLST